MILSIKIRWNEKTSLKRESRKKCQDDGIWKGQVVTMWGFNEERTSDSCPITKIHNQTCLGGQGRQSGGQMPSTCWKSFELEEEQNMQDATKSYQSSCTEKGEQGC
jgi:hypothetical protein